MFGLKLSFVATRSGLLRWYDHIHSTNSNERHFSEDNAHAVDETWYKRAVDQHSIEPESFVFSVPYDIGSSPSALVTATHAIFVQHKGHRAPAAVVGLQFQHSTLQSHFLINITSGVCSGASCHKTCSSEELDCYVLDNNGFIIISENLEHTGKFFGKVDGTIMDSLVQDRIYKKVAVYDYQGACTNSKNSYSGDGQKILPLMQIKLFLNWTFQLFVLWLSILDSMCGISVSYAKDEDVIYTDEYDNSFNQYNTNEDVDEEQDSVSPPLFTNPSTFVIPPIESDPIEGLDMSQYSIRRCDRKVDLYILQPERLNTSGLSNPLKGKLTNCHVTGCERPFSVQKIPHSNLILLVVDTLCPCGSKQLSIFPQEIVYESESGNCLHRPKDGLYRRRPPKCINYHPEEIEINVCGKGSKVGWSSILPLLYFGYNLILHIC